MLSASPIVSLIFSILLVLVIVKECLNKGKFYRYRLLTSFLILFINGILIFFYNDLVKEELTRKILNYSYLGLDILISLCLLFQIKSNLSNDELEKEIFTILDNKEGYIKLDNKGKILNISTLLSNALGYAERQACIGKLFSDVVNLNIRIIKVNEEESSNMDFFNTLDYITTSKVSYKLNLERYDGAVLEISFSFIPIIVNGKVKGQIVMLDNGNVNIPLLASDEGLKSEYASLKKKYQALLNLSNEGIYILDISKKEVYVNDYLVEAFSLIGNIISVDEFYDLILDEDYDSYCQLLNELSPNNPQIDTIYRMNINNKINYIKEKSLVIFEKAEISHIVGNIRILGNRSYETTNVDILDSALREVDLINLLNDYKQENQPFLVCYLRFMEIQDINEKYNREFGSMVMGEYLLALKHAFFVNDAIYRMSGLDFVFVMNDITKMDKLRKSLVKGTILEPLLNYGNIKLTVNVRMGIAYYNDSMLSKDIVKCAKVSLEKAIVQEKKYLYYKEYND